MRKCNVILNGEPYKDNIDTSIFTIAADGGYNMVSDRTVDVFIGDGDSVANKSISAREFINLPCEKDMTDGEYSIDYAIDRGFEYINLYGVDGGRMDHVMTNLNLFARASKRGVTVVGRCNRYDIYFSRGNEDFELKGVKNSTISLVPFDINTHIIDMEGLYYKVSNYDIARESSRGMSNVASNDDIRIRFGEGRCFVFVIPRGEE